MAGKRSCSQGLLLSTLERLALCSALFLQTGYMSDQCVLNAVTQVRRGLGEGGVGRMLSISVAWRDTKIVPT